ncbi:hypothetical protein KIS4809_3943 [Bacillus sp. ZZV12-4809]|nr:hypothetical protein KIS4809_3943 [Bacillus sp. ZZV12-4809]
MNGSILAKILRIPGFYNLENELFQGFRREIRRKIFRF